MATLSVCLTMYGLRKCTSTLSEKGKPHPLFPTFFSFSSHMRGVCFVWQEWLKSLFIHQDRHIWLPLPLWFYCEECGEGHSPLRVPPKKKKKKRLRSPFYFSGLFGSISSWDHLALTPPPRQWWDVTTKQKHLGKQCPQRGVTSSRRPFDSSGGVFLIKCCWKPFLLTLNFKDCTEFLAHWAVDSWA